MDYTYPRPKPARKNRPKANFWRGWPTFALWHKVYAITNFLTDSILVNSDCNWSRLFTRSSTLSVIFRL